MKKRIQIATHTLALLMLLLTSTIATHTVAQVTDIKAHLDSTELWIGQQSNLQFRWQQHPNQNVTPPHFSDSIVQWLQIVKKPTIDTIQTKDKNLDISINYTVTSFEDTLLYIPPFPFVVNGDTIWSNALSLKVIQPFQIDSTSRELADIKPIYQPPFDWKKLFKNILLILLIVALVVVIIRFVQKQLKQKPQPKPQVTIPKITITPYQEAINKLDKLKNDKLYQQGRTKEYHTQLTDILRTYILRTYQLNCMEMTSEEILRHIAPIIRQEQRTAYENLKEMLTLSDLVKFAKYKPTEEDNEKSLQNGYLFVQQTDEKKRKETTDNVKSIENDI